MTTPPNGGATTATGPQADGVEARVCQDIAARQQLGLQKYGTSVADNPLSLRQWLHHAYEECLDQAVYLRAALEKMDEQSKTV